MLIASLRVESPAAIVAQLAAARAAGADAAELRLDALPVAALAELELAPALAGRPLPVIATCRPIDQGGDFAGEEALRLRVLEAAATAGADWIDVEHDRPGPRIPRGKLLLSHHDFAGTPDAGALADLLRELGGRRPAITKLACLATCYADVARLLELPDRADLPLIALAMGPRGALSRVAYRKFGGAGTFAPLAGDAPTAPGQLDLTALRETYRADRIGRATALYGITGSEPAVAHSASPALHNAAFAVNGRDARYLRLPTDDLAELLAAARANPRWDLRGLSVTMPHKPAAAAAAPDAGLPTLNTLLLPASRPALGLDTDGPGAVAALAAAGIQLPGARVRVLGAGGVAASLGRALRAAGASLEICARRPEAAQALAAPLAAAVKPWPERAAPADLLINATPVGMAPDTNACPLPGDADLTRIAAVFETIYRPATTTLLARARAAGCTCLDGTALFLNQAVLQQHAFSGRDARIPLESWRQALAP